MTIPNEFVTFSDLGTLGGLSVAVYVLISVMRWALTPHHVGIENALHPIAVLLGVGLALATEALGDGLTGQSAIVAVINGMLAAGIAGALWSPTGQDIALLIIGRDVYRAVNDKPLYFERW